MKLTNEGLKNKSEWENKGYNLPKYDREIIEKKYKQKSLLDSFWCGKYF